MKDLLLMVVCMIIFGTVLSECRETKIHLCSAMCATKGQECASVSKGFVNKFTCRRPAELPPSLIKR